HKFILDLRAYGKGRMFFKTRAEADAECTRQKTLLERHSREAIGLSQREMSDFITARSKLANYGKTINDGGAVVGDHQERIRRCNVTIRQLTEELIEAKRRDGKAPRYLESLRGYLGGFCQEFGDRLIATSHARRVGHLLARSALLAQEPPELPATHRRIVLIRQATTHDRHQSH